MTTPDASPDTVLRPLADELVAAYLQQAPRAAALPPGRRRAVETLVHRALLDDSARAAHQAALTTARRAAGVHLELLSAGGPEPPTRMVAERGPAALSDAQLADLALSPQALGAVADALHDDPDLDAIRGRWFFDPLPGLSEQPSPAPAVAEPARPAARSRGGLAALFALAASVLGFGVFVGTQVRPGGREVAALTPDELDRDLPPATRDALARRWGGPRGGELLAGAARTRPDATRGPNDFVLEVENADDRRAFAAVVGLAAGRRPAVQASTRENDRTEWLAVEPRATRRVIPAPALEQSQTFVVVLTPVPAGDVVREAVSRQPPAATPEAVRDALAAELKRLGYPSLNVVLVRPSAGQP